MTLRTDHEQSTRRTNMTTPKCPFHVEATYPLSRARRRVGAGRAPRNCYETRGLARGLLESRRRRRRSARGGTRQVPRAGWDRRHLAPTAEPRSYVRGADVRRGPAGASAAHVAGASGAPLRPASARDGACVVNPRRPDLPTEVSAISSPERAARRWHAQCRSRVTSTESSKRASFGALGRGNRQSVEGRAPSLASKPPRSMRRPPSNEVAASQERS
jgi:hypothetical protein